MAATTLYLRLAILLFSLTNSSLARSATLSPEDTDKSISVHDPDSNAKEKEEILADLHSVNATIIALGEALSTVRESIMALRISNTTTNAQFIADLGCQIPPVDGTAAEIGKSILNFFIEAAARIDTEADAVTLVDNVGVFSCLLGVFRNILADAGRGIYAVTQEEHDELLKLISLAEAKAKPILELLYLRQHTLNETLKLMNDVLYHNNEQEYRLRRHTATGSSTTTTAEASIKRNSFDGMTINEMQSIMAQETNDLHFTLHKITLLTNEVSAIQDALAFTGLFQAELEHLEAMITSSSVSPEDWGIVVITHGPYCNGLFKSGAVLELFRELLEDSISATLALEGETNGDAIKESTRNALCRANAASSVVRIMPGRLSAAEISEVAGALSASILTIGETQPLLQERMLDTEGELETLRLRVRNLQSSLAELTEAMRKQMSLQRTQKVAEPMAAVKIEIHQKHNVT